MKRFLKFILLLGFWLLLSGSTDWQHIAVGFILAALLALFWRHTDIEGKGISLRHIGGGLRLVRVMLIEIWKSAWHVAKIVLSGCHVNPQLVWIETPLQSQLGRVALANCITLTPGTLTVSLVDNRLLVHALTPEFAQGLDDWRVHKILKKLEGKA